MGVLVISAISQPTPHFHLATAFSKLTLPEALTGAKCKLQTSGSVGSARMHVYIWGCGGVCVSGVCMCV